jgi:two-component system chemotaxis sensor kinase CheA
MVPVAHLFDRFPTQVRETARQLGKKVHLEVSGADTELDKVLIHQLADPLLHLLRNSLDHGIEPPAEREARGKPAAGRVGLHAYYEGAQAVIEVRDDGRGIDAERVRVKAIAAGLVDPAAAAGLTPQEIFPFIFEPGLSTAAAVSTVSGRGVGLDVVRTAVRQLQGGITVDSAPGVGTTIWLQLPLMLAVVGVLLVRERAHLFALAIQHVEEILAVRPADLRRAGGNTLYGHRGATLPVTTLSSVLGFPPSLFSEAEAYLVILTDGEKRVGVLVDAVLGRQEVLTKGLGSLIKRAPFVMGCTILSDSRLVLLLDAGALVHAQNRKPWASARAPAPEVRSARRRQPVLVVDDSAIQRNHLRALLGQAGYAVDVAENGFEAWQRAQQRHHAAYCVDLVMPVMDGVEFVGRLRRLPGREASPVVFITGRATPAERDRAAQLGGCAYFEKPVDADALVETLDRFCLTPAGREGGA